MFFLMFFSDCFQGGFGPSFRRLLGAILRPHIHHKIDGVLELFSEPFWEEFRGQNGCPNPRKK